MTLVMVASVRVDEEQSLCPEEHPGWFVLAWIIAVDVMTMGSSSARSCGPSSHDLAQMSWSENLPR